MKSVTAAVHLAHIGCTIAVMGRSGILALSTAVVALCAAQTPAPKDEQSGFIDDIEVTTYVQSLGDRLAKAARVRAQYRVILYDETIGLTLPGQQAIPLPWQPGEVTGLGESLVLVPKFLFKLSANEAECAAGIAHGLAHAMLRHGARREPAGLYVGPIPPLDNYSVPLHWKLEREADLYALGLLAGAGYDPEALVGYVQSLPQVPSRFRSGPSAERRVLDIRKALPDVPRHRNAVNDSARFQELKARWADSTRL